MKRMLLIGVSWLLISLAWAQSDFPEREFRAAWVATVKGIDWPSRPGMTSLQQQEELLALLDTLQAKGLNAIIFQVRPASDAFYRSELEPWSEWLTGRQGQAPAPYYDPLDFAIKACHDRGMELHAWFNPFRALTDWDRNKQIHPNHVSVKHPEWMLTYGKNLYIDPGIPEARKFVEAVILDVATRYEVDAIHFDDYFYPYKIDTLAFPDTLSFAQFGAGFATVDDWRRNNINDFIRNLHDQLREVDPYLPFGVSPFGVWRNRAVDPEGSDSRAGQTCYDDLYADVRLWLKNGWLDYVAPQIYFSIGYPPASFDKLLNWWEENAYGRHVYVGQAAYKVANNHDQNWSQPGEIPRQIQLLRESDRIHGSAYFSAKWFEANPLGMSDSLVQHYYRYPVLPPSAPWIDEDPPVAPLSLDTDAIKKGLQLTWEAAEESDHAYYVVYRTQGKEMPEAKPEHLHAIVWGEADSFRDQKNCRWLKKYNYLITAVDRAKNESFPSNWRSRRRWR